MNIFGVLYQIVDPKKNENHRYLMGALFTMAGHLRVEAKSYLKTMKQYDGQFKEVCVLVNPENPID